MFQKTKNIDTAFRHIRSFSIAVIAACALVSCFAIYKSFRLVSGLQDRIYVLSEGKVLEAFASKRDENIPVEARDHIRMFHHYFFTLSPDDKAIQANVAKALYLADASAKNTYDNLKEGNYFSEIISGNVSQEVLIDSIQLRTDRYPFYFKCFGTQQITRPTSVVTRRLVTEGFLRNISRSEHNAHGFLIEGWKILINRDIHVKSR
jgi:conjugative transposon TraK protein